MQQYNLPYLVQIKLFHGSGSDRFIARQYASRLKTTDASNNTDNGIIARRLILKNAGWDNGKIADEMHMSKASVSQAVSKCKKMRMEGHLDEAENKGAVSDNQDTV